MASVPYPKIWNSGEVLTAADLNAEFAAVPSITGLIGTQLADGATNIQYIQSNGNPVSPIGTSDQIIHTQAIAMTRTRCRIHVTAGGYALFAGPGAIAITMKIKRDGTTIYTSPVVTMNGLTIGENLPVFMSGYTVDTTTAAAHTYTVTLVKDVAASVTLTAAGGITLEEVA